MSKERELFINGVEVVLGEGTEIGVTFQANYLGELQQRQGDFTNTFQIPAIAENSEVYEESNIMTSDTIIPYRKAKATYRIKGIEVVPDGEAILKKSIDGKTLETDIVGGNIDLKRAIGDITVGELYADDEPHLWNLENIIASRDGSRYYIYPFIDWRVDGDTFFTDPSNVRADQMLPCCTAKGFFERLEAYTGYSFVGEYLESEDHLDMTIEPSDFERTSETLADQTIKSELPNQGSYTLLWPLLGGFFANSQVLIPEGSGSVALSIIPKHTLWDNTFLNQPYYPVVNEVANLKYTAEVLITWGRTENYGTYESPQSRTCTVISRIWENNGVTPVIKGEFTNTPIEGTLDWSHTNTAEKGNRIVLTVQTGEILLTGGNEYFVEVIFQFEKHGNVPSLGRVYAGSSKLERVPTKSIVYGNEINFRDLFRMKAGEVLKDILNLRGITIQTNSYTKEVSFNLFDDLEKNKPQARKWSNKVDVRSSQLEYRFGSYAQKNWFRFKENSEVTSELGDYYFLIDDETLEDVKDIIQLAHPATEQVNRYYGYVIPTIEGIDALNKWQKPNWRILQMNRQNTSFNVTITDGVDSEVITTSVPFCKFVGYDELIPNFHSVMVQMLQRLKALGLLVDIDPTDIQERNHVIPIHISIPQMNIDGYFYLNAINNYTGDQLTSVELIRL